MFEERNRDYDRRGESYDRPNNSSYGSYVSNEGDNEGQHRRSSEQYRSDQQRYNEGGNEIKSGGRIGAYNDENEGYGNNIPKNQEKLGAYETQQGKFGVQEVAHGPSVNHGAAQEYYNAPQDGQQNYNNSSEKYYQNSGYPSPESAQQESAKGMGLGKKVILGAGVAAGGYLLAKRIKSYKEKQSHQEIQQQQPQYQPQYHTLPQQDAHRPQAQQYQQQQQPYQQQPYQQQPYQRPPK